MNDAVQCICVLNEVRSNRNSWPAQLHDERSNPANVVAMGPSSIDIFCSDHTSTAANDTVLEVDGPAKPKTSPVIQRQLQVVEYVFTQALTF